MKAKEIYQKLEKDFIKPGITDDWMKYLKNTTFLSIDFKSRSMGIVCDNTDEIVKVYTAVFPTDAVLREAAKTKNALLFLHHPETWDLTKAPDVFQEMDQQLLKKLKENKVSVYNLHSALDNFGLYSTSSTLAGKLGFSVLKPFSPYNGGMAGAYGNAKQKTTKALSNNFRKIVGHRTSLYQYGDKEITNSQVAVIAGGGNSVESLKDVVDLGINTFVTGITVLNEHSEETHDFAKANKINILGGTHYSTEKFACMKMCEYFRKLGLPCKFIPGKPGLEDL